MSDTDDGVEVTFVVVGDATELRRRAHGAIEGTYPVGPETTAIVRRVHATIRDEPDGLVLHVVPIDPAELEWVRDAVHQRVRHIQSSDCE